jgi:hypothetical protein
MSMMEVRNMATKKQSSKARVERRRRRARARKLGSGALLLSGGLLILLAAWSLWNGQGGDTIEYEAEDISYEKPLYAVHEMASGPPIPFLPQDGPQPRIEISDKFFNFGSIGPTEVVTHEFTIANTGEAPLSINRAYTTCGCTTADFTSAIIPPGKVSIMTLRLDAGLHDVRGQTVRRGVIIENNDPNDSSAEIWIQASVRR